MTLNLNTLKPILLSSVLAAMLAGCAKSADFSDGLRARNIVGGTVSSPEFQKENGIVALMINTTRARTMCAGTLVSRNLVLTAAHCVSVSPARINNIYAIFAPNVNELINPVELRERSRRGTVHRIHESFANILVNQRVDLALIRLESDAPADFKTADLARSQEFSAPGQMLLQAGFGRTVTAREGIDENVGVLRQADGIEVLEKSGEAQDLMLDETTKGSCGGDSGGPAFAATDDGKYVQVGVNSRGTLVESCIGVGIYVNVASHIEWITAAMLVPADSPQRAAPAPQGPRALQN